ncbi:hypothetical protein [Stieleria mannarensis]|nr:hypothetical protein [Rhodopirellula sp. JC639]
MARNPNKKRLTDPNKKRLTDPNKKRLTGAIRSGVVKNVGSVFTEAV